MTVRSFRRAHARRVEREGRRFSKAGHTALVAGATLGASAVFATSAQAATTYTVTSAADDSGTAANCQPPPSGTVPNNCTLRDAIAAANGDGGGDTINFDGSLANQTITLSNGALTITSAGNTIDGSTASGLTVSGKGESDHVFLNDATSGTTTIENLTVEYGYADGGGGIASYNSGSSLALSGDTIQKSTAVDVGGGVFSNGPLTISNSHISGNTSRVIGGGVDGKYSTAITNSTISGNSARYGGGIFTFHSLSVSGSQITGNTLPTSDTSGFGEGGGIDSKYNGPMSVSNTTVSGNTSGEGGGIVVDTANGATVSNSNISGNTANFSAGGMFVDGYGSTAAGPVARQRAAQRAAAEKLLSGKLPQSAAAAPTSNTGGPISVSDSTISGNNAADGEGGGIWDYYQSSNSPVTVSASTLSGNTAKSNETAGSFGGGILLGGDSSYPTTPSTYQSLHSPFQLVDSTLAGNTADHGGGVSVGYDNGPTLLGTGGSVAFNNSTIDSNTANASNGGGGIYLSDYMSGSPAAEHSATAALFSTIVAGDSAAGSGNDLARSSSSTSGGFNASYSLIQSPGSAPLLTSQSLITGTNPQLGPLGNNGGPTQTMLPTYTSPVIDQGKDSPGLSTDQRGDARTVNNGKPTPPGGDGTDIGSVEVAQIKILAIIAPATGITGWQATLNGKINTNGQAVTWHFQWGTTTGYGQVTPSESISAGNGQVPVSFGISGLHPNTLYHYRVDAVAANGATSDSLDATFKTLTPTINAQPHKVTSGKKTRLFGFAAGCPVGSQVTLFSRVFSGHHPIHTTVQSGGNYSVKTKIPKSRKGGLYKITASCAGNSFDVTAHLRVVHPKAKAAKKPVRVIRFTG